MTFYTVEAINAKGFAECVVTCEYAWQALFAIEALAYLVPSLTLTLRVSPMNGGTEVLRVRGSRWIFIGATSRELRRSA